MATVGDRIRGAREARGWTQDRLSEETGLSKGFLSDVENGKTDISSDNLLKVANVLEASLDYLLRGEVRDPLPRASVKIPPELFRFAQEEGLSFGQTIELLEAHRSVVARRSSRSQRSFSLEDWKQLHRAIQRVFGAR